MANDKKYDKENRLIYDLEPFTGTLYEYLYSDDGNKRVLTITNENNPSNYKTVISQIKSGEDFVDEVKEEEGEKYTTRTTYNDKGQEVKFEKINKEKHTNLIKDTIRPEGTETEIYVINYEGK